jgi:hypothetical protein
MEEADGGLDETVLDLPNVPLNVGEAQAELVKSEFVDEVRKKLKIKGKLNPDVYRGLTFDAEGRLLFKNRRITSKKGGSLSLLSNKTLMRNSVTRNFLDLIGLVAEEPKQRTRDIETVAPEQSISVKSKVDSFKVTEDWARKERQKAERQLNETSDENERKKMQENVQYYDQIEIQAKRRYNEVVQNQFKRINTVINDETRPLNERLKELFRRDGLTIGALITAVGMTISTIILAVMPHTNSTSPSGNDSNKVKAAVKKTLIKLANFLLDLAKKALAALPGVIGAIVSFIFKKAGEAVLFLSEHLVVLLLASILALYEFILKLRRTRAKQ